MSPTFAPSSIFPYWWSKLIVSLQLHNRPRMTERLCFLWNVAHYPRFNLSIHRSVCVDPITGMRMKWISWWARFPLPAFWCHFLGKLAVGNEAITMHLMWLWLTCYLFGVVLRLLLLNLLFDRQSKNLQVLPCSFVCMLLHAM